MFRVNLHGLFCHNWHQTSDNLRAEFSWVELSWVRSQLCVLWQLWQSNLIMGGLGSTKTMIYPLLLNTNLTHRIQSLFSWKQEAFPSENTTDTTRWYFIKISYLCIWLLCFKDVSFLWKSYFLYLWMRRPKLIA